VVFVKLMICLFINKLSPLVIDAFLGNCVIVGFEMCLGVKLCGFSRMHSAGNDRFMFAVKALVYSHIDYMAMCC